MDQQMKLDLGTPNDARARGSSSDEATHAASGAGRISVHATTWGPAALEVLAARVAAIKADDPLRPVTVLVDSNVAGLVARRHLGRRGNGVVGISFVTARRIAEMLAAPVLASTGRVPATTPALAAAARAALAAAPGSFEAVAAHPSTVASLVRTHRELDDVSDEALDRLVLRGGRVADVVRLHRDMRRRLADRFYDEVDLVESAIAELATSTVPNDLGTIVLHLPQRLTRATADLLVALAGRNPLEIVLGLAGHDDADRTPRRSLARLGVDVPTEVAQPPAPHQSFVSVSDQREEAAAAAAAVRNAIAAGVAPDRIAVLHPSTGPLGRLIVEHLAEVGITHHGVDPRPVTARRSARWLLALLDEADDNRRRRPNVVDLIAPTIPGRSVVARLARVTRRAGVVAGRQQWEDRLAVRREELVAQERSTASIDRAIDVGGDLHDTLDALRAATSWSKLAEQCLEALAFWLGFADHAAVRDSSEADADIRLQTALVRLITLDAIEPACDLPTFTATLRAELEGASTSIGQHGVGVHVGPLQDAPGLSVDRIVLTGLVEGVLPSPPTEDSLLLDDERGDVVDELPARRERVGDQHRALEIALASAPEATLVIARGDARSNAERHPSRWIATALEAATQAGDTEHWPSFAHRATRDAAPLRPRDARLRGLATAAASGSRLAGLPHAQLTTPLVRGIGLVEGRTQPAFSRFDGNLATHVGLLPAVVGPEHPISSSHLQGLFACPHATFVQRILKVSEVEEPEDVIDLPAMHFGSIVHEILEHWLLARIDEGPPAPDRPWNDAARRHLAHVTATVCDDWERRGMTGHGLFWNRKRDEIRLLLETFVHFDDVRRRTLGLTPTHAELAFGMPGRDGLGLPAAPLVLPDGRTLYLKGAVDRVDHDADGVAHVIDYKTGRPFQVSEDDPVSGGGALQLVAYALGVGGGIGTRSDYWFTSTQGGFLTSGYAVSADILDTFRLVVGALVDVWESGAFVAHPAEPDAWKPWTPCADCDPDALGTGEIHRRWTTLSSRPELRHVLRLLAPERALQLDGEMPA